MENVIMIKKHEKRSFQWLWNKRHKYGRTKTEDNYGIIYSSWANSLDNPEQLASLDQTLS